MPAVPGVAARYEGSAERPWPETEGLAASYNTASVSEAYGHNARVFNLRFSPADKRLVASASDDSTAKVWQAEGAGYRQAASFHGHTDSVMCVNWESSGKLLATGSADTTVQLWTPGLEESGETSVATYGVQSTASLEGHPEEVYAVEFLEGTSSSQMLTASAWTPFLWDLECCQRLAEGDTICAPHDESSGLMPERWQAGHIFCAQQMPAGGPLVAAACSDGAVRFWSIRGGRSALAPQAVARAHPQGMGSACSWDPNGFQIASVATNGTVAVIVDFSRPLFSCQYIPGAPHVLALCGRGSSVSLVKVASAEVRQVDLLTEQRDEPAVIRLNTDEWRRAEAVTASTCKSADADVAEGDNSLGKSPLHYSTIESQSQSMGPRDLLCLAVSSDGSQLAASGVKLAIIHSEPNAQKPACNLMS